MSANTDTLQLSTGVGVHIAEFLTGVSPRNFVRLDRLSQLALGLEALALRRYEQGENVDSPIYFHFDELMRSINDLGEGYWGPNSSALDVKQTFQAYLSKIITRGVNELSSSELSLAGILSRWQYEEDNTTDTRGAYMMEYPPMIQIVGKEPDCRIRVYVCTREVDMKSLQKK